MGSLITVAPAPMVTAGRPPKVRARSVPGFVAGPPVSARSAMRASPMVSGRSPYWLEIRMRTLSPPIVVCTISRSVRRAQVSTGSGFPSAGRAGMADALGLQVAIQCGRAGCCARVVVAARAAARATTHGRRLR